MSSHAEVLRTFAYDGASRLTNVVMGICSAGYRYHENSPLVRQIIARENGIERMAQTREYDFLNPLRSIVSDPAEAQQCQSSFKMSPL